MTHTKKQEEEIKQAIQQSPPKDERTYLFTIKGCPGYEGYVPNFLGHEVCKYCGSIEYYH